MPFLTRRDVAVATGLLGLTTATDSLADASVLERGEMSIYEGNFIPINGVEQWVTIRGRNRRNPVVVWLHGGPGSPMSLTAPVFADWERDFTVVQWDQPNAGATRVRNLEKDIGPLRIDRYVRDAAAVIEAVCERVGQKRVFLMGISWGSLIGLELAHHRPDLLAAFIGTGMYMGAAGEPLAYSLALDAAKARNDTTGVAALEKAGPPPYSRFEDILTCKSYLNPPTVSPTAVDAAATAAFYALLAKPPADTSYVAHPKLLGQPDDGMSFYTSIVALMGPMQRWDARGLGRRLKTPLHISQGELDLNCPVQAAKDYLDWVEAPKKSFRTILGCAHNTLPFHDQLLSALRSAA